MTEGTEWADASLEDIIKKSEGGMFNNAAQVWNHTFYWNCLSPNGGGEPTGAVLDAINESFGSFAEFKQQFTNACATLFGSGWAFVVKGETGKLEIVQDLEISWNITRFQDILK